AHCYTDPIDNFIKVELTAATSLVKTFAMNSTGGPVHLNYTGAKTVTMTNGATVGALYGATNTVPILSDWSARSGDPVHRNDLDLPIDLRVVNPASTNILVDMLLRGTSGAGATAWDITT